MSLLTEEQRNKLRESGMKFPIVDSSCIGCSACAAISPEVFELNDEGLSEVIALDNYEGKGVEDSIAACPVDAISWEG